MLDEGDIYCLFWEVGVVYCIEINDLLLCVLVLFVCVLIG